MAMFSIEEAAAETRLPVATILAGITAGSLKTRAGKLSDRVLAEYNPELTAAEAADYLGMDGSSIRLNCRKGKIIARQLGPVWVMSRFALDLFDARDKAKTGRPRKRDAKAKAEAAT